MKQHHVIDVEGDDEARVELVLDHVATERRSVVLIEIQGGTLKLTTNLNSWMIRPKDGKTLILRPKIR